MNMEIIGTGAEATIYKNKEEVIKSRLEKSYRLKEIDEKLRKFRTRREAKVLSRLNEMGFPSPKLLDFCDQRMTINMEFVKGAKLRDVLHENHLELSKELGKKIGLLHANDIIHGDLTTSNMILDNELKFIDFGLSFFSNKTEDKAVDLHLLRQALESKHHEIWQECFEKAIEGYSEENPQALEVLQRLRQVEERGRNKNKH